MTVEADRNTVSLGWEGERETLKCPSFFFLPPLPSLCFPPSLCQAFPLSVTVWEHNTWAGHFFPEHTEDSIRICAQCVPVSSVSKTVWAEFGEQLLSIVFQHKTLRLIQEVPRPSSGLAILLNLALNVKYCAAVFKSTHCHSFQHNHTFLLCKLGFLIECALFTKLFAY